MSFRADKLLDSFKEVETNRDVSRNRRSVLALAGRPQGVGGGKKGGGNMKRKKFVNQKSMTKKFGIRNDQRKSFKRKKSKAGICLTERVGTNKKEKLQMRNGRNKRAK